MDLFLGVAAPALNKSLQRFVNKLVVKLSLQPMAFFPASKLMIYHVVALIILNFATLIIVILHFRNSPRKPPFSLWLRGMLAACHGFMWVINPHDINYEQAAATATLTLGGNKFIFISRAFILGLPKSFPSTVSYPSLQS